MDANAIYFILFIIANSYFMYRAGETSGKVHGMIHITQFYKQKSVLKDKSDILGFKHWPLPIQVLFDDPDINNF
jgi:hypothetical protein